jgi:hypothetical protein
MKKLSILFLLPSFLLIGCYNLPSYGTRKVSISNVQYDVDFGDEKWKVGDIHDWPQYRIVEHVPRNQSIDDWTELVTDGSYVGHVENIAKFIELRFKDLSARVAGFEGRIISSSENEALLEWWHPDSGKFVAEHQLELIKITSFGFWSLSYVKKGSEMPAELRDRWINRLRNSRPEAF